MFKYKDYDEEKMQTPDDYTDHYGHRDSDTSMHLSDVNEEEQSSNDDAPEQGMEEHASESLIEGEPEDEEDDEESLEEEVEQTGSDTSAEATGKSAEEEENNEETLEAELEQSALKATGESVEENRAHGEELERSALNATDACKEPKILSSPDILWSPEAMRRRQSSKITISPLEKSKHSDLKVSTPPARTLTVQRIEDEDLIHSEEHIGEAPTAASFARNSDASPILGATSNKQIGQKSSDQSTRQKAKRIRDTTAGTDTERPFKRRRLSQNEQNKKETDLDKIVPFYPDEDRTGPSKENLNDSISTGRSFVTRRKLTKSRTASAPQSSPLSELNVEMAKKYPEADSDSEEFFHRLERTMTKLARKYLFKIEDDAESFDSGVQTFERQLSDDDALHSDDDKI